MVRVICFDTGCLSSNCYVLESESDDVVLIDPGMPDVGPLLQWLKRSSKRIGAVLLTHEHADHCAGVNALYDYQDFHLFCSSACAQNIRYAKQNLSRYLEPLGSFTVLVPSCVLQDAQQLQFSDIALEVLLTPGHSPGSICLIMNGNAVFTGDTFFNNQRVPLNLPHSSAKDYEQSYEKLLSKLKSGMVVYPGHGDSFFYTVPCEGYELQLKSQKL